MQMLYEHYKKGPYMDLGSGLGLKVSDPDPDPMGLGSSKNSMGVDF